jgi:integrase
MENVKDVRKPRLVRSETEGWYILYYPFDVQKNTTVRKRKFIPKEYTTKESKIAYAKDAIKKLNVLLSNGYQVDRTRKKVEEEDVSNFKRVLTTDEVIVNYIKYCSNISNNTPHELSSKLALLNKFFKWADMNGYIILKPSDVTPDIAHAYCDHLLLDKGFAPKTFNNALGRLRNFYNVSMKRKWIEKGENPFATVDTQKTGYGEKNMPFSNELLKEMIPYVKETDPYLYKFIAFIYYAFMRCSEIKKLKVSNIDLENRLLKIKVKQSKVKKFDVLPISDELFDVIKSLGVENANPNHYLFSSDLKISSVPMSVNWTTDHFRRVKDHFELDPNYTIYSFKHTAVCRWYEYEKDIVRIQRMCRHTTIEMTARYLKSLGLMTDVFKIETLPPLCN